VSRHGAIPTKWSLTLGWPAPRLLAAIWETFWEVFGLEKVGENAQALWNDGGQGRS
jgi:hypothetical protein